ncbi:MAG: 2-oxoisovalerate dehydrogenase [Planctomycetaceae bacterium]|nr:2-oxoisovalerate dehydrogenase [Planctomycetaceae bacterium]
MKQKTATLEVPSERYPGHEQVYRLMYLGRLLDEEAPNFLRKNMGWSYHAPCAGHDAIQVALGCTFRQGKDYLFPYYRDLVTSLAAGLTAKEIILNGLSREEDVAGKGRHMSNHFAKPAINIQNVSSCVSNHAQHAAGVARAAKYYKSDAIAYASFGESSSSEGYVFEAINGSSREKLPVVFVMQDNGYGIGVPKREQSANEILAENYRGIGNLHIEICDGRDVFACFRSMQAAVDFVSAGEGCAIVYAMCARIGPHSNSDNHTLYRSEKELEEAKKRDPLPIFRNFLLKEKLATESQLKEIEADAEKEFNAAVEYGSAAPIADISTVEDHLLPPAYPCTENPEGIPASDTGEVCTLRQGINQALKTEFRRNPDTFMWGQDMASGEKEGIFKVSDGMQHEFGNKRVFNAPIAENYIVGTANGFSRFDQKIRVVVEAAEFADYVWPAMDQIIELSHEYWRTYGQFSPNVILRLASGGNIGGGLYHSQNLEAIFTSIPGLRVVTPCYADDAAGLMRTAMRSQGAILYLEPKAMYNHPFTRCKVAEDFVVPFGKARLRKEGNDISIITYGSGVMWSMKAAEMAEKENISVEVLDVRSLNPLDTGAIVKSACKTSRALVVHEDKVFSGFGGEIVAQIMHECFEYLDAPVERVGQKYIPVPFNKTLEAAMQPNEKIVFDAVKKVLAY